ncbi:MAG: hypothetical protein IJI65_02510 [Lachnospiraceae bacterium]|nr:hypothetical protein [Lachnospiraceae bacterium]
MRDLANDELYYWTFSFDLSQDKLKQFYKGSPTHAYDDVRKYLFENGFDNKELKEGSVYVTSLPLTSSKIAYILNNMFSKLPWFTECISKAVTATLPKIRYDYKVYADEYNNRPEHIKQYLKYCGDARKDNIEETSLTSSTNATTDSDSEFIQRNTRKR